MKSEESRRTHLRELCQGFVSNLPFWKGIKYEVFYKSGSGELVCLLVRLSVEGLSLLVGVFYKASNVQFLSFLDILKRTVSSVADLSEIVFMGDFNLDKVNVAGNFLLNDSVNSFNFSLV
jgi:hypothetical protein